MSTSKLIPVKLQRKPREASAHVPFGFERKKRSSFPRSPKIDEKQSSHLKLEAKNVLALMIKQESKEDVPTYKGRDAATQLKLPHLGYVSIHSKESEMLVTSMRSMFGDKHYRFRLGTALNMSSSGAGIVNSTLSNSVLTSQADFVSLSTVFNEFFVIGFHAHWIPNSRYQYPLTGTSTLSVANLPMGCAVLQHGQAAYSNLSAMTDNYGFSYHSTGDPFTVKWINTEKVNETVVSSLTAPTQSWCPVNNSTNYQGTLQFLTQSAPPALPFSQVLGTFAVFFDVLFRVRA